MPTPRIWFLYALQASEIGRYSLYFIKQILILELLWKNIEINHENLSLELIKNLMPLVFWRMKSFCSLSPVNSRHFPSIIFYQLFKLFIQVSMYIFSHHYLSLFITYCNFITFNPTTSLCAIKPIRNVEVCIWNVEIRISICISYQ